MWWGGFVHRRIKDIPAQYFLDLLQDGWAFGVIAEWIQHDLAELQERAQVENESGYTKRFYKYKYYKGVSG